MKKLPIIPFEKGLEVLGIGPMLRNKFAIGESHMALKKLTVKKISSEENSTLQRYSINKTQLIKI